MTITKNTSIIALLLIATLGIACIAMPAVAQRNAGQQETESNPEAEEDPEAEAEGVSAEEAVRIRARRLAASRSMAELLVGEKKISIATGVSKTDGPDFAALADLEAGDVVMLTRSQAIKLRSDINLAFGDVALNTNNVAENYPGVYSIWLKKTASGWSFVFNSRPDVWGTMYHPEDNVGEIAAEYGTGSEPTERLEFELEEAGDGGVLKFKWGTHQWSAKFNIAS